MSFIGAMSARDEGAECALRRSTTPQSLAIGIARPVAPLTEEFAHVGPDRLESRFDD